MAISTINIFVDGLQSPQSSFKELHSAEVKLSDQGVPSVFRATNFVEAYIEWQGRGWLLASPLKAEVINSVERVVAHLSKVNSPNIISFKIMPDELRWVDSLAQTKTSDLLLQELPQGVAFVDALRIVPQDRLLEELKSLQNELKRIGVSHNNLKADNLWWTDGLLVAVRFYDARIGEQSSSDIEAFSSLRDMVLSCGDSGVVSDVSSQYSAAPHLPNHIWVGSTFEGLIRIEDDGGFGYVDAQNEYIIEPQFLEASDFHESRATVRTECAYGLIDKSGEFVIEPIYEQLDYRYKDSYILAKGAEGWTRFNIFGEMQCGFFPTKQQAELANRDN